jgi:hypothetical protein
MRQTTEWREGAGVGLITLIMSHFPAIFLDTGNEHNHVIRSHPAHDQRTPTAMYLIFVVGAKNGGAGQTARGAGAEELPASVCPAPPFFWTRAKIHDPGFRYRG